MADTVFGEIAVAGPMHDPPVHDPVAGTRVLMARLGHVFVQSELLDTALTHPSWRNENPACTQDNQRLEFLGDSALGLIIAEALLQRLPLHREGQLTMLKSQLVRESSLADLAQSLGVGAALRLGRGEAQSGGRQRNSVLADALEAVIGAVLVDGGYGAAQQVVLALFDAALRAAIEAVQAAEPTQLAADIANWKTAAQELVQRLGAQPPVYTVIGAEGPDHNRTFHVVATVRLPDGDRTGSGQGSSKKAAQMAAAAALYQTVVDGLPPTPAKPSAGAAGTRKSSSPQRSRVRDGYAATIDSVSPPNSVD